jgi:hypothetical protein
MYAEYYFVNDTDITGKTPEHIARIDLRALKITVIGNKIFFVREE